MGRKSDARERLTAAALESFWNRSCASVSVEKICLLAGVNKGSFYHFFTSKTDIILAAIDEAWQEIEKNVLQIAFAPEVDPLDRIEIHFRLIHRHQQERKDASGYVPGCPFSNLGSELGTQDERVRQKVEEISQRQVSLIRTTLTEAREHGDFDGDPLTIAEALFAYQCGVLLRAKIANEPACILHAIPVAFALLGHPDRNKAA